MAVLWPGPEQIAKGEEGGNEGVSSLGTARGEPRAGGGLGPRAAGRTRPSLVVCQGRARDLAKYGLFGKLPKLLSAAAPVWAPAARFWAKYRIIVLVVCCMGNLWLLRVLGASGCGQNSVYEARRRAEKVKGANCAREIWPPSNFLAFFTFWPP